MAAKLEETQSMESLELYWVALMIDVVDPNEPKT